MHKPLILFALITIMTSTSSGQRSKENILAQKILDAFKSKSFDHYKQVLLDRKNLEELMLDVQERDGIDRQEEWKRMLEKFDQQADSTFGAEFKRIIAKGEKLGIDWAEVRFSDFVYKSSKAVNSSMTSLSGHINFQCRGINYVLFGLEATEYTDGYKANGLRTVQKGGVKRYVDPDLMDDEDL